MTFLPRFDGRSDIARRHKVLVRQLSDEWRQQNPGLRTTKAERDQITSLAWEKLAAEVAVKRSVLGEVDIVAATRATGSARRSERQFLRRVIQEPA